MRELTPQAAIELVVDRGLCRLSDRPRAAALDGGVSSHVVLVETDAPQRRWVLKQPCPKLKVASDWQCSMERIWREVEVLGLCGKLLAPGRQHSRTEAFRVPDVVFTDRENYVYAMTAAPAGCRSWKELLLDGFWDITTAEQCGEMLGRLHGLSWQNGEIAARLDDREFFEQLRVQPYYQHVLERNESCRAELTRLIESVRENRLALVHGDFSPKNLLISPGEVLLIDFEVGHYGDPAFDLGFFLTHLLCKEVHRRRHGPLTGNGLREASPLQLANRFWAAYGESLNASLRHRDRSWASVSDAFESRAMHNLGGCLLARIDGKSPLNYLQHEAERELIRSIGEAILLSPLERWAEVYEHLSEAC